MIDLMIAPLAPLSEDPWSAVRDREAMPMLFHEALARLRQREAEEAARRYRLARSFVAGRRWAQLTGFAARRAARVRAAAGSVPSEARVVRTTGGSSDVGCSVGQPWWRPADSSPVSKIHGCQCRTIPRIGTSASS